jgi:hypothetical protein
VAKCQQDKTCLNFEARTKFMKKLQKLELLFFSKRELYPSLSDMPSLFSVPSLIKENSPLYIEQFSSLL